MDWTRAGGMAPLSISIWITGCDLWLIVERDPLTAIFRLVGVSRSLVGIWKIEMNIPEIRLSPMVPVSNSAFALWPLTVM